MTQPDGESGMPCPPMSTLALNSVDCYGELRDRMQTADVRYLHQKSQECMEGRQAPAHTYLDRAYAAAGEAIPRRSELARFVPNGSGAARRSELATRIVTQRNYLAYRGKPLRGGGAISLQPLSPLRSAPPHPKAEDEGDEVYFDDERFGGAEVVFLNGEPHRIANGQSSERALYGVDSPTAALRAAAAKARSGAASPAGKANDALLDGRKGTARIPKQSGKGGEDVAAKSRGKTLSSVKVENAHASDQFDDYLSESGQRYRVLRLYDRALPPLVGGGASQELSPSRSALKPEKKNTKQRGGSGAKATNRPDGARGSRNTAGTSKGEDSASSARKRHAHVPKKPSGTASTRKTRRHMELCEHCSRVMSQSPANSSSPASPTFSARSGESEDDVVDGRRRATRARRGQTSPGDERRLPPVKSASHRSPAPAQPSRHQARVPGKRERERDRRARRRDRDQQAEKPQLASSRSASSTSSSEDWASASESSEGDSTATDCVVTDESQHSEHTPLRRQVKRQRRDQARRGRQSAASDEGDRGRRGSASEHYDSSASDEENSVPSPSSSSGSGASSAASFDSSSPLADSPVLSPRDRGARRRRNGDRDGRSSRVASRRGRTAGAHRGKATRRRGTRDTEPLKPSQRSSTGSTKDLREQSEGLDTVQSPRRRRRAHRTASESRPPVVTAVQAVPQSQGVLAPLTDELLPSMRYAPDGASPLSPQRQVRNWHHAVLGYLGTLDASSEAQQRTVNPVNAANPRNTDGHAQGTHTTDLRPAQQQSPSPATNPLRRSLEEMLLSPLHVTRFRRLSAVSSASSGPVCATPQGDGQHSAVSVHSRQSARAAVAAHTTTVPAEGLDLDFITEHVLRVLQRRIGGGNGDAVEAPDARHARLAAEAEEAAAREREAAAERERLRVLAEEEAAAAAAAAAQAEAEAAAKWEAAQQRVRHLLHEARDETQRARDAELSLSGLTTSVAFTLAQVTPVLENGEGIDAHPLPLGLARSAAAHNKDSELTMTNVTASSGTYIYGTSGPQEAKSQREKTASGDGAATTAESVLTTLDADAAALQRLVTDLRQMRERRAEERRVAQAKAAEERRVALEKAAAEERAREAQRVKAEAEAKALQQARQRQYELEALMADERRSRSSTLEEEEEAWDEVLVNAASQLDDVMHRIAMRQRNARLSLCEEEADARAEIVGTEEDEAGDFWDVAAHLWQAATEEAEARDEAERLRLEREAEAAMAAWREEQMAEAERLQAEVSRMEAAAQKSRSGSPSGVSRRSDSEVRRLKRSSLIPGQIIRITGAKSIEGGGKIRLVGDPHVAAVEARARERRRTDKLRQQRLSSAKLSPHGVDRTTSGGSSRPPSTVRMGIVGSSAGVAKPKNRAVSRNSRRPSGYMFEQRENNRVGQLPRRVSPLQSQSNFVEEGDVDLQINGQQVGTPARSGSRASSLASARGAPMPGVDHSIGTPYKIARAHEVNTMDIQALHNY